MSIKYPFGLTKDELIVNYKELYGGFYPIGENNLWHGGIHIKGVNSENGYLPVTPVFEGKIIAARMTEDYSTKSIVASIPGFDEMDKSKTEYLRRDSKTGKILSDEEVAERLRTRKFDKGITSTSKYNIIKDFVEKDETKIFYKLKDEYADENSLSDDDRITLAEALNLNFSNNFVLIKHETSTPMGKPISFYSLYMHLKNYGKISREEEKYRLFYFDKTFKVNIEEQLKGAILFKNDLKEEAAVVPHGSLVECSGERLFKPNEFQKVVGKNVFIKVKSQFAKTKGKEGYIKKSLCSLQSNDMTCSVKQDLTLYHRASNEELGTLKAGSNLKLLSMEKYNYYKLDNNGTIDYNYSSIKQESCFSVEYDEGAQGREEAGFELTLEKEGYVKYKSYKEVFSGKASGEVEIGGNEVSEVGLQLYKKNKEGDYVTTGKRLFAGDMVFTEYISKARAKELKKEATCEKIGSFFYRKVKYIFKGKISGGVKAEESNLELSPVVYKVDLDQKSARIPLQGHIRYPIKEGEKGGWQSALTRLNGKSNTKKRLQIYNLVDGKYVATPSYIEANEEVQTRTNDYWPKGNAPSDWDRYFYREVTYYVEDKSNEAFIKNIKDTGAVVRNSQSESGEVIDIIKSGTEIEFTDLNSFIAGPHGYHKVKAKGAAAGVTGYINTGDVRELKSKELYILKNAEGSYQLPLTMEQTINSEVAGGEVVVFDEPIPVTTDTVLGYPGKYLKQDDILHLEIFTDDVAFLEPKEEGNKKEEKLTYKIPLNSDFFKSLDTVEMGNKLIKVEPEIPGFCLFKKLPLDKDAKEVHYKNTHKVELVGGPYKEVWINRYGKNSGKYTYLRNVDRYQVNEDFEEDIYLTCPQVERTIDYGKEPEKITVKKGEPVVYLANSIKAYPETSPTELDPTYGDYRKIKIQGKEGWFKRNESSKKIFVYKESKRNYAIELDGEIELYPDCPQVQEKDKEMPESFKVKLFKGDTVDLIDDSMTLFPKTSPTKHSKEFGDYRKVKIHFPLAEHEGKRGYVVDNSDNFSVEWHSKEFCEIKDPVKEWYDGSPEIHIFKALNKPNTEEIYKTEKEIIINSWEAEGYDSAEELYYKIELDKDFYGWAKKSDFDNNVTKLNIYKWSDYGFHKIEEQTGDGIYDMRDIFTDRNRYRAELPFTKEAGNVKGLINMVNRAEEEYLNRSICKHPTEWKVKTDDFYEHLKKAPFKLEDDEIEELKSHVEALAFWDDVSGLPAPDGLYYFHPADFLEHLELVSEINVRELIKRADESRSPIYEGLKLVGYNRKINYKGMEMTFIYWGYDAIVDALNRGSENWEKTDLRNKRYPDMRTVGSYAENMERMLKQIFSIAADPDVQRVVNKTLTIGSTFRWNDKYKDPGHAQAIAIDLNGGDFYYCDSEGKANKNFEPQNALDFFELVAEKYGVKQILFNCPYIIKRAKKAYINCLYWKHHDHSHIDFEFHYSRKDKNGNFITDYNCKYGNYTCPKYNSCDESTLNYTLKFDECKSKPD